MQTVVNIGPFRFSYDEESGLVFIDSDLDSDAVHSSKEAWQAFVEATRKLCQCGGSCGCSRV